MGVVVDFFGVVGEDVGLGGGVRTDVVVLGGVELFL